jgi:hypothetical protein
VTPSPSSILVSLLLLIAAVLLIAMFAVPGSSPAFWWIVGGFVAVSLAAWLIPLNRSEPRR